MKKTLAIVLLAALSLTAAAQQADNVLLKREGDLLSVHFDLKTKQLPLSAGKAYLIVPELYNGADSKIFEPLGLYSRERFIHYQRQGAFISGDKSGERIYKKGQIPAVIEYEGFIPYEAWMDGAELRLRTVKYGCCGQSSLLSENVIGHYELEDMYKEFDIFRPDYAYVRPPAELSKRRSVSGRAFVEFPVNKTAIDPAYHNNLAELGHIRATVDSVRNNDDLTVTRIHIKGYASPEGPYDKNVVLARERTEAIRDYVAALYDFPATLYETESVPENWDGLRAYLEASSLPNRRAILEVMDGTLAPDAKEWKIKKTWASDWETIRNESLPFLRRTDYQVDYEIRLYSNVDEILRVMQTAPQNLSLEEFFLAAQQFESGSPEWNDIFRQAVKTYPDDPVANLNAANAEMAAGNYDQARRYLDKAGDSPAADYARGILAQLEDDLQAAESHFRAAAAAGFEKAEKALERLAD